MNKRGPETRRAAVIATIRSAVIAAAVFLAVCMCIDLIKQRPVKVLTGGRAGGVVAIVLVVAIEGLRKRRKDNEVPTTESIGTIDS